MYVINNIKDIRIMELSNGKLNELKNGIEEYVDRFNDDNSDTYENDLHKLIISDLCNNINIKNDLKRPF